MTMPWTRACLAFIGFTGIAVAGRAKPVGVEASSYLISDQGQAYEAKNLMDGKADSAWIEGEDGSGLGSWVKLDLGALTTVTGFRIWNGYWISYDFWQRHNRAKEIEVQLSDGATHAFTLKDEMKAETVRFPSPVTTDSIRIKVKGVYKGNTFNDTGFSEIQVLDTSPSSFVSVSSYQTSTTLASDADGNYDPGNLVDGIKDSMWCEGNATGDGTGEWIEFDFGRPQKVSKIQVINGVASGVSAFFAANHATSATLQFSDGAQTSIKLRGSLMPQTLMFPPKSTSKVKMTFTGVKKGTKYNDLCVSEVVFLP